MLFSSKISSTVLAYLDELGADLSPVYDQIDLPVEFLKDSSYWIEAPKLELLLKDLFALDHKKSISDLDLAHEIGLRVAEYRTWGALDSVLRMMPRPQELLLHPERFFSYFISPPPPAESLVRTNESVEFDLPISSDQFPLVTAFLSGAFSALPCFAGGQLGCSTWEGIHFAVSWSTGQTTLLPSKESTNHAVSPQLLNDLVVSLQKNQSELEERNRNLLEKNAELVRAKEQLELMIGQSHLKVTETLNKQVKHSIVQLKRMKDYMVRGQQLITLLVAQDRMSPTVQSAIKRVDWDFVKEQFPLAAMDVLRTLENFDLQSKE